jgi:TonB family protein
MRLPLLAAATVLTSSVFAADPGLVSLAMPDAQFMAGVNVAQAMLSPLGQFLLTQPGQLAEAGLPKLIETTGFDPRRDLREVLVSSSGLAGSDSGLFLARGTFDIPKILEAAQADGAILETYKGVSIAGKPKQDAIAFSDSTLAITGDPTLVRAAIDRISAPAAISAALAAQVNQLSAAEDAWFVSMAPLSRLQPSGPAAMLNNVQQASGGVKFGASAAITLQAVSATAQDAAALAVMLKSLGSMGIGVAQTGDSAGDLAAAAALLQNMSVTADGPITKVSLSVPETQIEQMIANGHAVAGAEPAYDPRSIPADQAAQPSTGLVPQRMRVSGNVEKAKLVQHAEPVYPPLALQARISGVVRLNAVIGKDGTVQKLTLVSGHPLLVQPAMDAVKQWVYAPTLLNGQPVEVATQVEVNFSLEQ